MTELIPKLPGVLASLTLPIRPPLERTLIVLPAPDQHEKITLADGRSFRIPSMQALADQLNVQEPAVRIDWDHESEPEHPNYQRSTRARGWMSNWSVTSSGELMATARFIDGFEVRAHQFRYHSPSLRYEPTDDTVIGISSVALTNRPALGELARIDDGSTENANVGSAQPGEKLLLPNRASPDPDRYFRIGATPNEIHPSQAETNGSTSSPGPVSSPCPQPMQEMHLAQSNGDTSVYEPASEGLLAAADTPQAFYQSWLELAQEHLDSAVASGKMGGGEKSAWLEAICSHRRGLAAGISLFRRSIQARPQLALAQRHLSPTSLPPSEQAGRSISTLPPGYSLSPERLSLHHRVTGLAARQNLPYEQALMRLADDLNAPSH